MEKIINKPVISVIMPAFNASDYIQESINSVIAQKYSNWELIIVDDGSTDSTSSIIIKNSLKDSRIKYFYQENGKQGKARNLGIAYAKGMFVAFLDADDLWMPEKLEIQLEEIQLKNVDLVFSDSYIFDDNNFSDRSRKMNIPDQIFTGDEALKLFLEGNRIPTLTVLVKKEKIHLVNGFTEKKNIQNAEDYHLWLKMIIKECVFYGSDKILASYRMHSKSSTSQDRIASKQIPEVFFDLIQNKPQVKQIILNALKKELFRQYNGRTYTKSNLYVVVEESCRYLDKQYYSPFLYLTNFFFGVKITKKLINHLLNA
jgi:teichuronic acid biosynthesis glycosyltransferase TuaG